MVLLPIPPATIAPVQSLRAPEGWKSVPMKNGQVGFAPDPMPTGKLIGIVFWPEEVASGNLKAWFSRRSKEMGAKGDEVRTAGAYVLTSGVSGKRPFILAAVRPSGKKDRARVGMLIADANELKEHSDAFMESLRSVAGERTASSSGGGSSTRRGTTKATPRADPAWANLPASNPAKALPPASLGGAKVFIVYRQSYGMSGMEVRTDPIVLFPDGSLFDGGYNNPLAAFTAAEFRKQAKPYDVGRWSISGNKMTLTYPKRREPTTVYRKIADGWTDDKDAKAGDAWDVYRPVVPGSVAKLQGAWKTSSLSVSGMMGGGAPMVASGSNGSLVFKGDRFADESTSFASATTSNMGDAFKTGGDVGVYSNNGKKGGGRYRLDGLLLTREKNGKRGVELCFLMPNWDGKVPKTFWIAGDRYERPDKKK